MSTIFSTAGQLAQLSSMRQAQLTKTDANGSTTVSKDEFVNAHPKNVSEAQATSGSDKIDGKVSYALTKFQTSSRMESNKPSENSGSRNRLSSDVMATLIQHAQQISASTQNSDNAATTSGSIISPLSADSKNS